MRTVALVQARTDSSRLPGKVLADLDGKPVIEHVITAARAAERIDDVVVATTDRSVDEELVAFVTEELSTSCYAGEYEDVLRRLRVAAEIIEAQIVVRLTADCPFLDPAVIDRVVGSLGRYDYASNVIRRTYPKGLDTEAIWMDTLARLDRLAQSPKHRASPTTLIFDRPELFATFSVEQDRDESKQNLCVDTPEDLERLRALCVS